GHRAAGAAPRMAGVRRGAGVPVVASRPVGGLAVGGAGRRGAGAALGDVALTGRGPADRGGGLEPVGGAGGAGPRTGLGEVAGARGGAADRPGVSRGVLAGDIAPVALVERADVAVVAAGGPAGLLRVRRAARGRSR